MGAEPASRGSQIKALVAFLLPGLTMVFMVPVLIYQFASGFLEVVTILSVGVQAFIATIIAFSSWVGCIWLLVRGIRTGGMSLGVPL